MTILQFVSPRLEVGQTVAVVGSSASLLKNSLGEIIDRHDDVIRFNRAPTLGYENHVGHRTTIRVSNNHVFNGNSMKKEEWTNQPPDFIRNIKNTNILYIAPDLAPWHNRKSLTDSSSKCFLFSYGNTSFLKRKYQYDGNGNMTVGLITLLLLLESGVNVSMFGFDIESKERSHYYEKRPNYSTGHQISPEQKIMKNLINNGYIRNYG